MRPVKIGKIKYDHVIADLKGMTGWLRCVVSDIPVLSRYIQQDLCDVGCNLQINPIMKCE